jgi:hypothetical protein
MEIPGTVPLAERDTLLSPAPRCIVNTNEMILQLRVNKQAPSEVSVVPCHVRQSARRLILGRRKREGLSMMIACALSQVIT